MIRQTVGIVSVLATIVPTCLASADDILARFYLDGELKATPIQTSKVGSPIETAIDALVAGPTAKQAAEGLVSAIPTGTKVESIKVAGNTVTVDLSPEALNNLTESSLTAMFDQFRTTLMDFTEILGIRLTCQGELLAKYLPPAPDVKGAPPASLSKDNHTTTGLDDRNITIGPSHGRYWNGSGWYWQRSLVCEAGENLLEDTNSIRLMQFLYQYLTQDGATVHVPRELNESNCCHSETGYPWWKMCAQSWLRANGLPCSVWAAYTGACGAETDAGRYSDDIRARPLFADYRGSDIYIAHHTNAGGSGTANGTETFRDTEMEHPEHETNSYNLALAVQNSVIDAIRTTYPGESGWSSRGVKDSEGGFGEIRVPNRPAILIELAFHDNCTRDGIYLQDNFFRSLAEWGIYNGVCQYFGTSPTWDKYSCELVSENIPTEMTAGNSYNISITFRNRGVVWDTARNFRLGAVDGSDPFAATRYDVSGETRPGETFTFNFTMTAPSTAGTYTTDWQMLRENVAWFGPTITRQVVVGGAPVILTHPTAASVMEGGTVLFTVSAAGTAPLSYRWQHNNVDISDGEHYANTTLYTLRVMNVDDTVAGQYRCVVTNSLGSTSSNAAELTNLGLPADFDGDKDVDMDDFGVFQSCISGSSVSQDEPRCSKAKLDSDTDVDQSDLQLFRKCLTAAGVPTVFNCTSLP